MAKKRMAKKESPELTKEEIKDVAAGLVLHGVEDGAPKLKGNNFVVAFHEDYKDDQKFWSEVFHAFLPDLKYLPFGTNATADDGSEAAGDGVLQRRFQQFAGQQIELTRKKETIKIRLVICTDADSKYLYNERIWYLNKPYIFHTHAYSIENFNCIGTFINEEFEKYSLRKVETIDFVQLFTDFSEKLTPLFCYWIYACETNGDDTENPATNMNEFLGRKAQKEMMNMEDFCKENEEVLTTFQKEVINELERRANECIESAIAETDITLDNDTQNEILNKCAEYGINKENLFLYFKGHWVFEQFLLPIAKYQFLYLKEHFRQGANEERLKQINNQFGGSHAESNMKIQTIMEKIHEKAIFRQIEPISKIMADLQRHEW